MATLLTVVTHCHAQLTADQISYSPTPVAKGFNIIHCGACGDLDIWAANGVQVTTLEIVSTGGLFRGTKEDFSSTFNGLFDVYTPEKAFKLAPAGFGLDQTTFGNLGGAGNNLTFEDLVQDLRISGSLVGGGSLADAPGGVWIVSAVPEPGTLSMLGLAAGSLLLWFRNRSR
ncbi:MAG: PEP-CTERM sorting domain-containing protein [Pirellulaceae bacterium]